jgi:vacuolar-type H+-ATPase subunit E/Vma4
LEIEREEKQKIFNLLPEIIKLEFERSLNEWLCNITNTWQN